MIESLISTNIEEQLKIQKKTDRYHIIFHILFGMVNHVQTGPNWRRMFPALAWQKQSESFQKIRRFWGAVCGRFFLGVQEAFVAFPVAFIPEGDEFCKKTDHENFLSGFFWVRQYPLKLPCRRVQEVRDLGRDQIFTEERKGTSEMSS